VGTIAVPTLLLHGVNDPIIACSSIVFGGFTGFTTGFVYGCLWRFTIPSTLGYLGYQLYRKL
jgi:hypothetical protein